MPLSPEQRRLLDAVSEGRVEWKDTHPRLTARRRERHGSAVAINSWHIDGEEAYGSEIRSLDRLSEVGWITATEGEQAVLTETGKEVHARA